MHSCRFPFLTASLLSLLLLAACGPGEPSSEPVPAGNPTEQPAPDREPSRPDVDEPGDEPDGDPASIDGVLGDVSAAADGMTATATLQDVRAARHEGYDRIVFAFDGTGLPGYTIGYTDAVAECGSGRPVDVRGEAILEVSIHSARAHTDAGQLSIDATSLRPGLPVLQVAQRTCDFEGEVAWALGLSAKQPFSVQRLSDPPRIVVDIAHGE